MGFFGDSLILPNSIKSIGAYAFHDTSIHTLHMQEGLESIGPGAFHSCHWLNAVTIPGTVKKLSENAFADCSELESVQVPEHLKDQVEKAFRDVYPEVEYICY